MVIQGSDFARPDDRPGGRSLHVPKCLRGRILTRPPLCLSNPKIVWGRPPGRPESLQWQKPGVNADRDFPRSFLTTFADPGIGSPAPSGLKAREGSFATETSPGLFFDRRARSGSGPMNEPGAQTEPGFVLYSATAPEHASLIMKKSDLELKNLRQLLSLAAQAGIAGRSRMKKAQLVTALAKHLTQRLAAARVDSTQSRKPQRTIPLAAPPKRLKRRTPGSRAVLSKRRKLASAASPAVEVKAPFKQLTILPAKYGRTRLTLMEVNPHQVHAFWEITPADRAAAVKRLGSEKDSIKWVLRLYISAPDDSQPADSGGHFDVPVDLGPGNWYMQVPAIDRSYRAELGPITADGRFEAACRSNAVHTPRSEASPHYQPQWLEVSGHPQSHRHAHEPPPETALLMRDSTAGSAKTGRSSARPRATDSPGAQAFTSKTPAETPPSADSSAPQALPAGTQIGLEMDRPSSLPSALENVTSFGLGAWTREIGEVEQAAEEELRRSK